MNSLNKVQLIGNLTADPIIKETPGGKKVANFSLATNRIWKDASGMKQEQVEYHNVVVWDWLAELAEKYLVKGKKAYIEGRLQTRSWDDPSGQKKYRTEVIADNIILLSSANEGSSYGGGSASYDSAPSEDAPKVKRTTKKAEEEIDISDIPF